MSSKHSFPKYRVQRLLRRIGSQLQVFEATQEELGRRVEIRLLDHQVSEGSEEYQRFKREFTSLARLDHPGLLRVYDWGLSAGRIYYVAEHREAPNLREVLEAGTTFDRPELLRLGVQLAQALEYLHAEGILHRGLALESVLYDAAKGRATISEFSLVKDTSRDDLTSRGVPHLVPLLRTPELVEGWPVDGRIDQYLLGLLLYRLCLSDPAQETEMPLKPRPIGEVTEDLPEDLAQAIMQALAWRPEERHPDMAAFALRLADIEKGFARRRHRPAARAPDSMPLQKLQFAAAPKESGVLERLRAWWRRRGGDQE